MFIWTKTSSVISSRDTASWERQSLECKMINWLRLTRTILRQLTVTLPNSKKRGKVLTAFHRSRWILMICQNMFRWRRIEGQHSSKTICCCRSLLRKSTSNKIRKSSSNKCQTPNKTSHTRALSDQISQNKWKGLRMSEILANRAQEKGFSLMQLGRETRWWLWTPRCGRVAQKGRKRVVIRRRPIVVISRYFSRKSKRLRRGFMKLFHRPPTKNSIWNQMFISRNTSRLSLSDRRRRSFLPTTSYSAPHGKILIVFRILIRMVTMGSRARRVETRITLLARTSFPMSTRSWTKKSRWPSDSKRQTRKATSFPEVHTSQNRSKAAPTPWKTRKEAPSCRATTKLRSRSLPNKRKPSRPWKTWTISSMSNDCR